MTKIKEEYSNNIKPWSDKLKKKIDKNFISSQRRLLKEPKSDAETNKMLSKVASIRRRKFDSKKKE